MRTPLPPICYLLANAQLYATTGQSNTGALEASLATYDRALAAAQQEKPAQAQPDQAQPDQAWKDGVSKIYVGKGNALLKLKRTADAIDNYNRAAELSSTPGQGVLQRLRGHLQLWRRERRGYRLAARPRQVDPTRADAWFILGSVLFMDAKPDAQGKFVDLRRMPPGAREISRACPRRPPCRRHESHARRRRKVISRSQFLVSRCTALNRRL